MNEHPLPPDDDGLATAEFADVLGLIDRVRRFEESSPSGSHTSGSRSRSDSIPLPERVGRFEIRRAIGSGGFGLVFEAFDPALHRTVAIKLPRPEIAAAPRAAKRFLQEGRAAAALNHPHIVPVFEVGEISSIPYIATAYCAGPNLFEQLRADPGSITPHAAAEIVSRLADAVEHAHRRGVLHRDLKPSNILLDPSPSDSPDSEAPLAKEGCLADWVRITDFGLAKIEDADVSLRTAGSLGTPSYMPPEQADPTSTLGPTADVYSLGAILYELLCGRPPFREPTILATLDAVRSRPPVPPSRLVVETPRDLEAITLTCMEKRPGDRYPTAAAVRDDLDRYLRGEPVRARRVRGVEKAWRWCRRNPVVSGLAMVILLLAIGSTATAIGLAVSKRETTRALEAVTQANRQALQNEYDAQIALASSIRNSPGLGQRVASLEALRRAAELARELDLGHAETRRLRNDVIAGLALSDLAVDRRWPVSVSGETFLATDPDCESYVDVDDARSRLIVRRITDNTPIAELSLPSDCGRLIGVEFSRDGARVGARYERRGKAEFGRSQERIRVWGVPQGDRLADTAVGGFGHAAEFAPDGASIALIPGDEAEIEIRELPSFTLRETVSCSSPPKTLTHSPDGETFAVYGDAGIELIGPDGRLWDSPIACPSFAYALRFSPDGNQLAAACGDARVRIYDLQPLDNDPRGDASRRGTSEPGLSRRGVSRLGGGGLPPPVVLEGHGAMVVRLAWHPTEPLLGTVGMDGKSCLWDLRDGRSVVAVDEKLTNFSRDGRWLGIHGGRMELRWSRAHRSFPQSDAKVVLPVDLGFYPRGDVTSEIDYWVTLPGSRLMVGQNYFRAVFRDPAVDRPLAEFDVPGCWFRFSDDGRWMYASSQAVGFCRLPIQRRSTATGETIRIGPPQRIDTARGGAFALSGDRVLLTPYLRPGRLLDAERGETMAQFDVHPFTFWCDLSDSAQLAATGAMKASDVRVFDAVSGEQIRTLPSESAAPWFSPDGKWLIVAENARYTIFDTATWERTSRIDSVAGGIWPGSLAFSPDGQHLALEIGKEIRLVDADSLNPVATFQVPSDELIESIGFSGDGRYLVSGGGDQDRTHVWDLAVIRDQLRRYGLDWDAHPAPSLPGTVSKPIRLELDLAELADPASRPKW